jgi:hypothetical protein
VTVVASRSASGTFISPFCYCQGVWNVQAEFTRGNWNLIDHIFLNWFNTFRNASLKVVLDKPCSRASLNYFKKSDIKILCPPPHTTSHEKSQLGTETETNVLRHFSKLVSPERCVITYKTDFYSSRTTDSFQIIDDAYAAPVSINTLNTPQEARP